MTTIMNLNLLPSEAKFQATKNRLEKKVRMAMIVMAVVWIVAMIGVYGTSFVFGARLKVEETKRQKTLNDYGALSDSLIVNQTLKYKAKMVGKTLATRFEYGKAFETVNSLFPEGIKLDNFEMDPGGFFKVTGTTIGRENVDKLERLVETINSGGDARFVSIALTSLSVKSGEWKIGMEVTLK